MSDAHLPDLDAVSGENLTVQQVRALAVRHSAPASTYEQVCQITDVSERTLYRWLAQPLFRRAWDDEDERIRQVRRGLRQDLELRSLRTLIDTQDDATAPASVKVDAAAKGLTHVQRAKEHEDAPAGMALGALLAKWLKESDDELAPADDPARVSSEAREGSQ